MKIAVRIDDITPDMDWDSFVRFKEILDRYRVKPLLGVVPHNQDANLQKGKFHPDFWDYLKDLQKEGFSIAMHGLHHRYTTRKGGLFPLNHFSEFAGLSFEQQKAMLSKGKEILRANGIETPIFMAPGHTFDSNTLKALQELGFRYVTDGFSQRPYRDKKSSLIFLPIAFHSSRDIEKPNGYTTLVFHMNETGEEQFARYESLFQRHQGDFISYEALCGIKPQKSTLFTKLKEKTLVYGKFILIRCKESGKAKKQEQ